jgi:hypothetical protein
MPGAIAGIHTQAMLLFSSEQLQKGNFKRPNSLHFMHTRSAGPLHAYRAFQKQRPLYRMKNMKPLSSFCSPLRSGSPRPEICTDHSIADQALRKVSRFAAKV